MDLEPCSLTSSEPEQTRCERHRDAALASPAFRPRPAAAPYVPQCDEHGAYEPTQCHVSIGQCWCVDASGQEVPNTRTGPGHTPLCESTVLLPDTVGSVRPDRDPV